MTYLTFPNDGPITYTTTFPTYVPPYTTTTVVGDGDNITYWTGISAPELPPGKDLPVKPTTIRTKAGYRGQIMHENAIIWEGPPRKTFERAQKDAVRRIAKGMRRLVA